MLTSTLGVSTAAEGFSQAPRPCQKETPGALGGGGGQQGSAGAFVVPSVDQGSCGRRVARSEVWGGKAAGVGHMAGEGCSHPCLLRYRPTSRDEKEEAQRVKGFTSGHVASEQGPELGPSLKRPCATIHPPQNHRRALRLTGERQEPRRPQGVG